MADVMSRDSTVFLRAAVSIVALVMVVAHMLFPRFILDAFTAGLIIIPFLPLLSPIIKSIEVSGVGKLELKVEEVKEKQALLREEVDGLRFLVSGFVTEWEYLHLKKLAPFNYQRGSSKDDRFTNEIIRLRDFGL